MPSRERRPGLSRETVTRGLRAGATLIERGPAGAVNALEEVLHGHSSHEPDHSHETADAQRHPDAPRPVPPVTSVRSVSSSVAPTTVVTLESIARDGFTAPTRFHPEPADVLIVCCSSEKFELQNQELVAALGYQMPHFIQVPGGPASLYGLAAFKGFLAKAMGLFVDKAIELIGVKNVILIAHEECGGYKEGQSMILGTLTKRLTGKGMKETQLEHLRKAARDVQARLGHGITVTTYYGNIITNNGQRQIHFERI